MEPLFGNHRKVQCRTLNNASSKPSNVLLPSGTVLQRLTLYLHEFVIRTCKKLSEVSSNSSAARIFAC